ncbi:Peptide chain release factor 1 [Novipirellula galeiformis]|uniref:Peptide chain release factor 1 n=2 Tax=Novipirellula galeiformis TaxID=2528004 RepID=A0A5C6CNR8_9BACT|nr:Peptide chain release factor 1 [Novipirellula galeiformis]
MPEPAERMPIEFFQGEHPCVLAPERLLEDCELRTQRRSGPGGQHRNKTSSGVFLLHRPSETVAEATERRSQAQNRDVALERLRFTLAVEVRTKSIFDSAPSELEASFRNRYRGNVKRMNQHNVDKPALLAMLLNDLHAVGGQPSLVARQWKCSTSAIVTLVQSVPTAFALVNRIRNHHQRLPLR